MMERKYIQEVIRCPHSGAKRWSMAFRALLLLCVFGVVLLSMPVRAQVLQDPDKPLYMPEDLQNRKALVGRYCVVNKLVNVVGVGSWIEDLNNLVDEDLNNESTFPKVVGVGIAASPIVSVRDMSAYYGPGVKAGFCVVASSGSSVLSLDVISTLEIYLYRDGEFKQRLSVEEGQSGSGVNLSLISLPGSDDACAYLTVTADSVFDEVGLVDGGGLSLSVGTEIKVKYAFVGEPEEYLLTRNGIKECGEGYSVDAIGYNPVLLGIPLPWLDSEIEKVLNDDLTDFGAITPIISAGYRGGAKFMVSRPGNEEAFKAGSEVGFKYMNANAVDLAVGSWIEIWLFDRNGNKVQSETVSAEVLGLGVAEDGSGFASLISDVDFSQAEIRFHTVLSISLGAMGVYYGFVREQPDVPHKCDISPTVNTNICEEQTSFQLESNPALTVSWSLISKPQGSLATVTPGGYVSHLDSIGEYVFRATAADGCYEEVVLTHGGFETSSICGTPLVNIDQALGVDYELSDTIYETSGALISISELEDPERVLDADYNNFATYTSGLGVANDLRVIGVKAAGDTLIYDGGAPGAGKVNVGFVVEFTTTGLDLSVLEFFQIRLYNDGVTVYEHVVDESNVISLGLAGSDRTQKVRFGISVDPVDEDGNPIRFDEMMLWKSGVLNLTVSVLNIYYPYIEDGESDCADPLGCGTTILSVNETGTTINANETQMASAVQVAAVLDNLSFLVDDDFNTAVTLTNTVTVGGGVIIAIKMGRTLDFRHQVGLVTDNKTYVAGITAGDWLTMATYYQGEPTGDEFSDWGLLGVNVIGYGDKNFLLMQPKQRYDEIRLTIGQIAGVLDIEQSYYGFFLRGDIDNDGIPDCQDPESCFTTIDSIELDKICLGDTLEISGIGMTSTTYFLRLPEQKITDTIQTASDGRFTRKYRLDVSGRYNMLFYDGSGNLVSTAPYSVHPVFTEWKQHPVSDDWDEWNNWTEGVPYCCTDVVIPSGADFYPDLKDTVKVGDEYCCGFVHFSAGAAVEKPQKLNYRHAWVDLALEPDRYYMLSAPLKNMYTGDMFVPEAMRGVHTGGYFDTLDAVMSPQNRFNPRIYQRLWSRSAPARLLDGSQTAVNVDETFWSRHFNGLAYAYPMGTGFSLWVDPEALPTDSSVCFRFPKVHTEYNYFDDYDKQMLDIRETGLDRTQAGRFIYEVASDTDFQMTYEGQARRVYIGSLPLEVELENEFSNRYFLVGNPFMSYIDVQAFLEENPSIRALKVYDGNVNNTVVDADGVLVTSGQGLTEIAPMQSFFAELASPAVSLRVRFTEGMMVSKPVSLLGEDGLPLLRVSFGNDSLEAHLVLLDEGYDWVSGEGLGCLFDNEVKPKAAVFALWEEKGYDIMPVTGKDRILLGLLAERGMPVRLSFRAENGFDLKKYRLLDCRSGRTYPLDESFAFEADETSLSRFALVNAAYVSEQAGEESAVYVTTNRDVIEIRCIEAAMRAASLYDMSGRLVNERSQSAPADYMEMEAGGSGAYILRVLLDTGDVQTFKILVWE